MLLNFKFFEGHQFESVIINQATQEQYLNIPKNASTWAKTIFPMAGFDRQAQLSNSLKTIIIFRDPIDRWLSGFSTWLSRRLPHISIDQIKNNQALLDVLFDTLRHDEHTERQIFYVQNVNWGRSACFFMDDSFTESMNQYFVNNYKVNISAVEPKNQSNSQTENLIPKQYFQQVLESNPKYLHRVKEYFEIDYKLLRSLRFKNTRHIRCCYYDS